MGRLLCGLALLALSAPGDPAAAAPIALRGATLLDLSEFGRSARDIPSAVVVIDGERIVAAGRAAEVSVPAGAAEVDLAGGYIVPGLVDAFAVQNNQAQARAHLYMGVTTIVAFEADPRRGMSVFVPDGPSVVFNGVLTGYDQSSIGPWSTPGDLRARGRALGSHEIAATVDAQAWNGYGAQLLYYSLAPDQVRAAAGRLRQRRMLAIGELGHTNVLAAARMGVPLFVHEVRYLLDLAPPEMHAAVADRPFVEGRRFLSWLDGLDPDSPELRAFGDALAAQRVALMPTLALTSLMLPDHANPWREPAAALIDPRDIMLPADPETGLAPPQFGLTREQNATRALHLLELQRRLAARGVKFVVGSGADAFGVLPGIGAHVEMELLVRIGLTPRQALAAATSNLAALAGFVDYGVIRPGARADLLVLDADPTRDIRNVRRIVRLYLRGREVDRAALLAPPAPAR